MRSLAKECRQARRDAEKAMTRRGEIAIAYDDHRQTADSSTEGSGASLGVPKKKSLPGYGSDDNEDRWTDWEGASQDFEAQERAHKEWKALNSENTSYFDSED